MEIISELTLICLYNRTSKYVLKRLEKARVTFFSITVINISLYICCRLRNLFSLPSIIYIECNVDFIQNTELRSSICSNNFAVVYTTWLHCYEDGHLFPLHRICTFEYINQHIVYVHLMDRTELIYLHDLSFRSQVKWCVICWNPTWQLNVYLIWLPLNAKVERQAVFKVMYS